MNKVMLLYPPGKLFQRSEDRAQCNLNDSATGSVHACNDLGYCAAVLLEKGYEVFLRDYQTEGVPFAGVVKDVRNFKPDMIVLSTTNSSVKTDLAFLKELSRFHRSIYVMKGALFYDIELDLLSMLDLAHISCFIGCEMEFVIGSIVDSYLRAKGKLSEINGIIYKENGVFQKNPILRGTNNLDSLPFPARQLMKNELYVRPDTGEPMATIQTGLGCPSACTYCLTPIISGRIVRKRAVENVYKEIEECFYQYGIKNFFFKADTFTIDEAYAISICDRIIHSRLNGKIAFTVNSRVKPLSMRLLKKLKQAGCFMIAVGFESGSDKTLQKIRKATTVQDNLKAAQMIHKAGIPLYGYFMIGFPWEDRAMILKTERIIHRINPDFIEVHIAMPYYGTEFYKQCEAYGVIAQNGGFGCDAYAPNTTGTVTLSLHEVQKIKKNILLRFYLRPQYIMHKFTGALSRPVVMKNYIRYGLKMLSK